MKIKQRFGLANESMFTPNFFGAVVIATIVAYLLFLLFRS